MWVYENKEITNIDQFSEDTIGFVYLITHIPTGKKYIGKKILTSTRRVPMLKRELAEWDKPGRKPKKKLVVKESDWQTYYSSNKWIKDEVKRGNREDFKREILKFCNSKKQLSYYETKYQFAENVLESDEYLNDNILGKFFKTDV